MRRFLFVIVTIGLVCGLDPAALRSDMPDGVPESAPRNGLTALAAPPPGWRAQGVPVTAAGEALFKVINGGAEIYMQAGFRRAVFASLQNSAALTVNLEIYEMQNPAAARSIFAQKAGGSGIAIPLGQGARLEAHYLNFWRGRHQVTVSGYAATPETAAAIRAVAAAVDHRLREG
jgi:hypothetical protein